MAMMYVGEMLMPMGERRVMVRMVVRLGAVPWKIVLMLVMFIVYVSMRMLQLFVDVFVTVFLSQMQPDTQGH
jgi:hypothetical protein